MVNRKLRVAFRATLPETNTPPTPKSSPTESSE